MPFIPTFGEVVPLLIVTFAVAMIVAVTLTPLVRRVMVRLDAIDAPDQRRVNKSPIPRGGGIAVAFAFLVVAVGVIVVNDRLRLVDVPFTIVPTDIAALLAGGALATVIGFLDDYFQLRARWQLLGQLAVAVLAVAAGITIPFLNNPLGSGTILLEGPFAVGFTILWIVGMINSINFIDGLDGLSSGIALIAAVTLGLISLTVTVAQPFIAVLCFALAGSLLGFLRWNFHPATIFIGTSGVMFVGYTLAVLAILGTAKVAVALLVLGVPIIDTFWIIVRRLVNGTSPFTPDRGHIHHRLLDLGLTHGQTVLVIYAMCVALALLTFLLSGTGQLYAFMGLALAFGLGLFLFTRDETGDALEAETYERINRDPPAESA
ncbi:MAG TPA: MraY family glycosyltransferase [Candidatus Limnocylindrales bacterium]|nr:MraY family glycosyltransferase [Candidatus Limnocylindrales bacterium]